MSKLRVDKIAAPIVKDEFTGSVFFDGTGDYLSIPDSTDFDLGISNEPFTIEFWFYKNSAAGTHSELGVLRGGGAAAWNSTNGHQYRAFQYTDNTLYWQWWNGSANKSIISSATPAINTWHHFAVSYDGTTTRAFLNGVVFGTSTEAYAKPSASNITRIGRDPSDSVSTHGYHSNVRICKGHALYTENFTPSTRELPVHTAPPKGFVFPAADNVTVLLACQSSTDVTADSSGRHTITANGDVHAQSANPGLLRRTLNLTTVTENTGSVYFDGISDTLGIVENGNDFDYDADFSIEFWVYFNELKSYQDIAGTSTNSVFLGSNKSGWVASYYTSGTDQFRFSYQDDSSWTFQHAFNFAASTNTWYHVAYQRHDGNIKLYVNGVQIGSTYNTSTNLISTENRLLVGSGHGVSPGSTAHFHGYLSNLRICKGHAVYTSNFAPPTRELKVHGGPDDNRTVLLCCHDGDNIFEDKSGRHIIAAYGDRLSSPTPTATDSPVGVTTHNPGLTRNVDPTAGPTFQGGAGFTSRNWLTLPKGTTAERNQTGGRAIQGAGYNFTPGQTYVNSIFYYQISSTGNALDFGDLLNAEGQIGSLGSSTRGIFAGQSNPVGNVIQFVTIATTGNAVNFGEMTDTKWASGGAANSTRGLFAGGRQPGYRKTIDYITIATLGDAADFGDLTALGHEMSAASSPTRAIFAGGSAPGGSISNLIDYVTIASTGDALDFGDLTSTRKVSAGVASQTRMCVGGGLNPGLDQGIEYLTISTLGNAKDFGNLTGSEGRWGLGGTSNSIRGVFGGGYDPSPATALNTMDYITIASTGNANDFGDIGTSTGIAFATGLSDSHGGIS